jgi:hypothetical protein
MHRKRLSCYCDICVPPEEFDITGGPVTPDTLLPHSQQVQEVATAQEVFLLELNNPMAILR